MNWSDIPLWLRDNNWWLEPLYKIIGGLGTVVALVISSLSLKKSNQALSEMEISRRAQTRPFLYVSGVNTDKHTIDSGPMIDLVDGSSDFSVKQVALLCTACEKRGDRSRCEHTYHQVWTLDPTLSRLRNKRLVCSWCRRFHVHKNPTVN